MVEQQLEFIAPRGDLPLIEGENSDIWEEATQVAGPGWMKELNTYLGGQAPETIISRGDIFLVRNVLRLIKHVGIS